MEQMGKHRKQTINVTFKNRANQNTTQFLDNKNP